MAQFGRPTSDVVVGDWATAPLYEKIDEAVADDGDFIVGSGPNACEVALSPITNPGAGDVTLRFRYRKAPGASDGSLVATLLDGATQIKQVVLNVTSETFALHSVILSAGERALISDWSNLRVRFERPDAEGAVYAGTTLYYAGSTTDYAGASA